MNNREEGLFNQDVAQHEDKLTSSVGALWPPERASFERIKGIYTDKVISTPSEAGIVIGELHSHALEHFTDRESPITKVSIRAVLDSGVLRAISEYYSDIIEAVIPLEGTQAVFENSAVVYFGFNQSSRRSIQEEIDLYKGNLSEALAVEMRSPEDILNRTKNDEYEVGIVRLPGEQTERDSVIDQITFLYGRFGWSRDDVKDILTNENNIIACARFNRRIVSAGIAEMAVVPVEQKEIRMIEITEAATLEDHARSGLYTSVSTTLLLELVERSKRGNIRGGELDYVFGECNGNAPGVLRTARIQGRTFSAQIGHLYGLPDSGILRQHVPISGAPRTAPYNDLFPAFITREKLYEIYG